jgi:hypothetical protein
VWPDQSSVVEHTVDAGGADRDNISIEHHEGKPTVTLQRMPGVEVKDGFFLPILQPPIAWDQRIVLVGQAVARAPVVELARGDSQPCDESLDRNLGADGPVANVIDDRVANVMGDPGAGQSSPSSFFSWIWASINSATTSFLRCSLSRSAAMVRTYDCSGDALLRSKTAAPFSKKSFCQA